MHKFWVHAVHRMGGIRHKQVCTRVDLEGQKTLEQGGLTEFLELKKYVCSGFAGFAELAQSFE